MAEDKQSPPAAPASAAAATPSASEREIGLIMPVVEKLLADIRGQKEPTTALTFVRAPANTIDSGPRTARHTPYGPTR
jgi:hypothetical protein